MEPGARHFGYLLAVFVVATTGCGTSPQCGENGYPPPPEGEGEVVLYVSAHCGAAEGDGSADAPFATITAALEEAATRSADLVLVASGTYDEEALIVSPGVSILGAGSDHTLIVSRGPGPTVTIRDIDGVSLSGVSLQGDGGLGVLVQGATNVVLADVVVSGYVAGDDWDGRGIHVEDSASVHLQDAASRENTSHGVVYRRSSGVIAGTRILDNGIPGGAEAHGLVAAQDSSLTIGNESSGGGWEDAGDLAAGDSRIEDNTGIGLYAIGSEVTAHRALVSGNLGVGVGTAECAEAMEGVDCALENPLLTLEDCLVRGGVSDQVTISVWDAPVTLEGCRIEGTYDEDALAGHCVLVDVEIPGIPVEIIDCEVDGCSGAAMVIYGPTVATISGNTVTSSGSRGGLWLFRTAEQSVVSFNAVVHPRGVGVVLKQNAGGTLHGNYIDEPVLEPYLVKETGEPIDVADGIVISELTDATKIGTVHLSENMIELAGRVGLFLNEMGPQSVSIKEGNAVAGSGTYDVLLQNGAHEILDVHPGLESSISFETDGVVANPEEKWLKPYAGELLKLPVSICIPPECTELF